MCANHHFDSIFFRDEGWEIFYAWTRRVSHYHSCSKVYYIGPVLFHLCRSIFNIPSRTSIQVANPISSISIPLYRLKAPSRLCMDLRHLPPAQVRYRSQIIIPIFLALLIESPIPSHIIIIGWIPCAEKVGYTPETTGGMYADIVTGFWTIFLWFNSSRRRDISPSSSGWDTPTFSYCSIAVSRAVFASVNRFKEKRTLPFPAYEAQFDDAPCA